VISIELQISVDHCREVVNVEGSFTHFQTQYSSYVHIYKT